MRVLLFDIDLDGHRSVYLRRVVEACRDLDVRLTLATARGAARSQSYHQNLAPLADRFELDEFFDAPPRQPLTAARVAVQQLREAIRRHAAQHAYIPYGDGLAQLAVLGALPGRRRMACDVELILHHSQHGYPARGLRHAARLAVERLAWRRNPFACVHHVDLLEYDAWRAKAIVPDRQLAFLPDPVDPPPTLEKRAARERLGLPVHVPVVGVVGQINPHKGCVQALAAFDRARLPEGTLLLLAGLHASSIQELLATRYRALVESGRVASLDGFLPLETLHAALAALDLSLVTHQNHVGISSIALRSAAARRPVLGANTGWIEAIVPRFGLGWTCDVTDADRLAEGMERALPQAEGWRLGAAGERLLAFHALSNFEAHITHRLRARLGLPPDPRLTPWESVER